MFDRDPENGSPRLYLEPAACGDLDGIDEGEERIYGTLDCCGSDYAIFSFGGNTLCPGTEPCPQTPPSENVAKYKVEWTLCAKWYCASDSAEGDCLPTYLTENEVCSEDFYVCSGPYDTYEDAEAECPGDVGVSCCPGLALPSVMPVRIEAPGEPLLDGVTFNMTYYPTYTPVPAWSGESGVLATVVWPGTYPLAGTYTYKIAVGLYPCYDQRLGDDYYYETPPGGIGAPALTMAWSLNVYRGGFLVATCGPYGLDTVVSFDCGDDGWSFSGNEVSPFSGPLQTEICGNGAGAMNAGFTYEPFTIHIGSEA